ncbi:hypothetical protein [Winogradskya humida]|uniref:Phasin protein n=1 Tax=Winogradskya humida TaxID=113566 RepID=A0ABQ3ZFH4_9ACTN|nr:hypothetical protein [Actinoplanes humidus]GIE17331.1 hypothetical protein Ahu01nite_004330 [Actinoplanes humidus]
MTATESGFAAASRTFVSRTAEFLTGMERRVMGNARTAQSNAYEAMLADRARAQARADMDAMVAALAAAPRPRNNTRTRVAH